MYTMTAREFLQIVVAPAVGIVAILAVVVFGGRWGSHHYSVIECGTFSRAAGRETKFVDYSFWNWGCLTPTSDGKWIDVSMLRDVDL